MKKIVGIGASPGIAIGLITYLHDDYCGIPAVQSGTVEQEQQRFIVAQAQALAELKVIEQQTAKTIGAQEAQVFISQALMLQDPLLEVTVAEKIAAKLSAEAAVQQALRQLTTMLASLEDTYLRERAADVQDVGKRLVRILQGKPINSEVSGIVVAHDLLPSDRLTLNLTTVQGFVAATGGTTSHSSIIARAAGIPAVVGIGEGLATLAEHSRIILDGDQGLIFIDPDEKLVEEYQIRLAREQQIQGDLLALKNLPALTIDGQNFEVAANIGTPQEMAAVVDAGADGVGLFRTEFLFLQRAVLPTEAEQVAAYQAVLSTMPDKKIIIRTLDAGGDNERPFLAGKAEANPALGLRAIRLCLVHREVFKTQLRALLQASLVGNLHIMFPMIATLEELVSAKELLAEAKQELVAEGVSFRADIPVGIMIEVPAAAVNADLLASEVDFFSIGTNDLVQYTMAADRMNDQVAMLSDYFQPAVLRLIQLVVQAARENGKWVGLCGEMAGDPLATPLLVGLGITEFSMHPRVVAVVKNRVRNINTLAAREWADCVVKLKQASQVRKYLMNLSAKIDQQILGKSVSGKGPLKKIAIMTSGGDCPGMNAAIRAAVRVALNQNIEVWGIRNGYAGMIANEFIPLDSRSVGDIIQKGGTFLGTARSEQFKTVAGRTRAYDNLKQRGIEGVLVLGGDGSLRGAVLLGELGMNVVGLPATIDNDIYGTDYTIGFDTAVNTAVDAINKLRDTASSHGRVMVIEVMGRHCGAIALTAGLAGGAESILIPEEPVDLDCLCEQLVASKNAGKQYSIVVVAEGTGSALQIGDRIASQTGLETRVSVLGHIQRGGAPTVFDRMLASMLAERAVLALAAGVTQVMYGTRFGQIVPINIHEAVHRKKNFDCNLFHLGQMISQ